jgi:hypothetical protein
MLPAYFVINTYELPAPNRSAPAIIKSAALQFTSFVNCIATRGTSRRMAVPSATPVIVKGNLDCVFIIIGRYVISFAYLLSAKVFKSTLYIKVETGIFLRVWPKGVDKIIGGQNWPPRMKLTVLINEESKPRVKQTIYRISYGSCCAPFSIQQIIVFFSSVDKVDPRGIVPLATTVLIMFLAL